jgi:hypothetical protein
MHEMRVGERYRLRFINADTTQPAMRMRLLRDSTLLEWRAVAKDGMPLPTDQAIVGPSEKQMGMARRTISSSYHPRRRTCVST